MIRKPLTLAALAILPASAQAGGIERSTQSIGALFQPGNYVEFSFASVRPEVSGIGAGAAATPATPTPGIGSGGMATPYATFGVAIKMQLSDKLDAAFILDQPFGAGTSYPLTGYYMSGSMAELHTTSYTGLVKYRFDGGFSAIAGLRAQTLSADILLPPTVIPPSGYTATGATNLGFGYVVGAAYEKPEIGLRVALTYNSKISHDLATTENIGLGATQTTTDIVTPQSINLEAQTGLSKSTLAFGSVRWVEWSEFEIAPPVYAGAVGSPIVDFNNDKITYTLGLAHKFNDTWSMAGSVSHEKASGGFSSNLSPTDGRTSIGLAAIYTNENLKVTTGISHTWIGDATTQLGGSGIAAGNFEGNTAWGFGMKIGVSF